MLHNPAPRLVMGLRLGGILAASMVFGGVAAGAFSAWSVSTVLGTGLLFGTAFAAGTGYRLLLGDAPRRPDAPPVSWSGAGAASALFSAGIWLTTHLAGADASLVVLAYGLAINVAYLLLDPIFILEGRRTAMALPARALQYCATVSLLLLATVLARHDPSAGAAVAIGGHLVLRLLSPHLLRRWNWSQARLGA